MAPPKKNYREVRDTLGQIKRRPASRRPDLLAFLLFDERESHRIVQEFTNDQATWLDAMASAEEMVLFFFLPRPPRIPDDTEPTRAVVTEAGSEVKNPSLEVAARFGLTAKDLPGVVFFTDLDLDEPGPHVGVFCRLSVDLFKDRRNAEDKLASLFNLVHTAGAQTARALIEDSEPGFQPSEAVRTEKLLGVLRVLIETERAKERAAPFLAALRTGVISLIKFPGRLAEVTAIAFGQELGKRTAQGTP
jgi:hypothetical protein